MTKKQKAKQTIHVKLGFRIIEYHTIERAVDAAPYRRREKTGVVTEWLEQKFRDDPMPDSDMSTDSIVLDAWAEIPPPGKRKP